MANSDNRYEMLPLRELSKLSWVVGGFLSRTALRLSRLTMVARQNGARAVLRRERWAQSHRHWERERENLLLPGWVIANVTTQDSLESSRSRNIS